MNKSKKEIIFERIEQDKSLKEDVEFKERINKIFGVFGEDGAITAIVTEYTDTAKLEQGYTNLRWRVYIILSSISFAIAGYVLSTVNSLDIPIRVITLFFAWFIHLFATFYYWWMHKLAHTLEANRIQIPLDCLRRNDFISYRHHLC